MSRAHIIGFALMLVLAGCALRSNLSYDKEPDTVVLYADLQPLAGPMIEDEDCVFYTMPVLRVWGDGFVFLDDSTITSFNTHLWSGNVSGQQMTGILSMLERAGFFSKTWKPKVASEDNPWFTLGSHLRARSVRYATSEMNPQLYQDVVKQLLPMLKPFDIDDRPDARLDDMHIRSLGCGLVSHQRVLPLNVN